MNPNDCEHTRVETLYQYDAQKNRTVFWACPECHMLFHPKGLADADLVTENETLREYVAAVHEEVNPFIISQQVRTPFNQTQFPRCNKAWGNIPKNVRDLLTGEQGQVLDGS